MSTFNACPYADSRRFPATDGGLRTALTKKEVLKAKEEIDAVTSASALQYYIAKNVAFIGEPDGSATSRLYNTTLEAWRALDDSVWDLAKSQDKMREAMQALQDEMNATSRIMLRMEEEKGALDKMMERHMPEI
jgi:DNA repair ATPase RecN